MDGGRRGACGLPPIGKYDRQISAKHDKGDNQQVKLGGCGMLLRNIETLNVNPSELHGRCFGGEKNASRDKYGERTVPKEQDARRRQ